MSRWADGLQGDGDTWGEDPAVYSPELVGETVHRASRWVGPGRYLDTVATGWEHVPERQALLVANHSGGTSVPDMWGLLTAWYERFGTGRPLFVLGHELIFGTAATARYFARRGVMRASTLTAERVLARGHDLLITPGGDRDVWRPWAQRWNVDFAGRTGYARLALEHRVPIVPVAGAGAHHTLLVIADGHRLARALGLAKAARAEVWPLHLSVPWGLAFGPWPHVPVPRRLRFRAGPLIDAHLRSEVGAAALDGAVRASLQHELDALREEWPAGRRGVGQLIRDVVRPE
jgi:1-acyl-sn-glycerol-3-phosphate acyltransferase